MIINPISFIKTLLDKNKPENSTFDRVAWKRRWKLENPELVKAAAKRDYEKRKPQILAHQKEYMSKKRAAWTPEERAAHLQKRHEDYLKRSEAQRLKRLEQEKAKDELFLAGFKACIKCNLEKSIENFWRR